MDERKSKEEKIEEGGKGENRRKGEVEATRKAKTICMPQALAFRYANV
jgi:hypothetical protein